MRSLVSVTVLVLAAGSALLASGATALAEDTPPPIVEDFAYPDADKIFKEKGIRLYRGDGNIVLVECSVGGDPVRVKSRNHDEFCFKILGPKGKLTMELDQTYAIRGNNAHNVSALVWVNGQSKTVTVPKREWIGVGEGTEPGKLGVLLEINASS